jgi:IS5 family transposase
MILMASLASVGQVMFFSDAVVSIKRNPYYQYFCGYSNYMPGMPCNATELVHFRKRIGIKGFNLIFKISGACLSKSKPTISLMGFEGLPLS